MTRLWSLVLLALVAGAVGSCKSAGPGPSTAWPFTPCPGTGEIPRDMLAEIMDLGAADMPMANPVQQSRILQCGFLVAKCWLGTQPPLNDPGMTLDQHCQAVRDALGYAKQSLTTNPNKWNDVYQELGHGH